jgi:glycosyltransferase involved in cell wall biosynthesis
VIDRIAVVVPAADEAELIKACLDALRVAAARVPVSVHLIAVLDGCRDATAEIVTSFADVDAVVTDGRNVGAARRLGAARALGAAPATGRLWLASTDADTVVPPYWLEAMLRLAATSDVVLGIVVPDVRLRPRVARRWHARHVLADGHPHVHAANLGIRGDAYAALGGWRALRTGEDEDLAARAVEAGLRVTRSALAVTTSSRADGRAPEGFSSYLRALGQA